MLKILLAALFLAAPGARAAETGCVYGMHGEVRIQSSAGGPWAEAYRGTPFSEGDAIRTGESSWCELLLRDGSFIRLDADAQVSAEELRVHEGDRFFLFSFLRGKALWLAAKLKPAGGGKFEVRTPSAVCAVRGTDFAISVSTEGRTDVGLFDGAVLLSTGSSHEALLPGGEAEAERGRLAVQARLSRLMLAEERRWKKLKSRVERLRERLRERQDFIDRYVAERRKALSKFKDRQREKVERRN